MLDLLMIVLTVVFFAAAFALVAWLERVWASPTFSNSSCPWPSWCTSPTPWSARSAS